LHSPGRNRFLAGNKIKSDTRNGGPIFAKVEAKMNKKKQGVIIPVVMMICLTLTIGGAKQLPVPKEVNISETEKNLAQSSNRFGIKLFQEIIGSESAENVFISPLSVSYALAMTLNGANGKTRQAILSTLELNDIPAGEINSSFKNITSLLTGLDESVTFDIANSIWFRSGLPVKQEFVDTNKINFDALVTDLDFSAPSAAETINGWVDDNTNGKIKNIVSPPIEPSTIMFLINAIYFKGSWGIKFDPSRTVDHPFYPSGGKETECRMMFNTEHFDYFQNDKFQAIRLPYGDAGFNMLVFLPDTSRTVDDLIDQLNEANWALWEKSFYNTKVKLGLPRFKFEYDVTMNDVLKAMGMEIAFNERKANFRKMVDMEKLPPGFNVYIDKVKHKTFLQVDEEGTEAAAVTSVTMGLTSAVDMGPPEMIIERPFLFAIGEKNSGSIVFIGQVSNPVWTE
jgi:serpin B